MLEEKDYDVTLTLRITTRITFSPIERPTPITARDAIENGIGSIPEAVFEELKGEGWEIAYPIDGEAVERDKVETDPAIRARLEELRVELRAERMSYSELAELQGLAEHIDPGDVELLEAAGVPEFPDE